jgi:phage terminase large subunit
MIASLTIGQSYLTLFQPKPPRFVLYEGPRGTAKTRGILTGLMCYALKNPGARIILSRSTRTRLTETVLTTLEEQVYPAFGMRVPGDAGRVNRHSYDLPNGSSFIPIGLDDPQRTTSMEAAKIYVSEGIEIGMRQHVEALAGALRQPGMPDRQCIIDTNPGPPGHWLNAAAEPVPKHWRRVESPEDYQRLLEHAHRPPQEGFWKRIVTRHQDNPGYFDLTAWQWTDAGREYLDTLQMFTGHLRRRWLDGDWVAAEGTVFPEFDEDRHVIEPFNVPADWPTYVGWDAGFDHPTAILWFTVAPTGCIYVYDEIYRGGRAVSDHCRHVHEKNAGRTVHAYYADPQHCFSQTAQSPKTIASQAKECGISMSPWPRTGGNEETMVERVREKLRQPSMFKVFRTCQNTINEFQSWSYKRDARGDLPAGEDKFEDRDNHSMDVVKGVISMNIQHKRQLIRAVGAA